MNSDVYVKKAKLVKELKENNVNYEVKEIENGFVFRIRYMLGGQRVFITLVIDGTIYNDCYIDFGSLDDNTKKGQILELMNQINNKYRIDKMYLSEDGNLMQSCTYISRLKDFDAEQFVDLLRHTLCQLQDEHLKQFMKIIWS